jgi:hypothetical protein
MRIGSNECRWRENEKYQSKDSDSIGDESLYGTDDIHLWVHYFDPSPAHIVTNAKNTPVQYVLSGDNSPGIVGLGSASTLMQSLVDQKLVSAKTYGLFIGDGMERAGPGLYHGGHTFGGYDAAHMTGTVHTYDMDLSQPDFLPITIADIIIDDPNNSQLRNRSVLDNGASFDARITNDQYPMRWPARVTQNFADLLEANSSDSSDNSLQTSKTFDGVMRIRLSDGFEITLPKDTVITPSGLTPVEDNTDENYDGPFYLSTAWLSQVYLTLDYDAKKFHLAQAIMNTTYIIPQSFCPGSTPVPHNYGAKSSGFVKNGLVGAVIGGVIGGLAVSVATIYIVVWWRRQQLVKEQNKRWAETSAAWKSRHNEEMEMESLSPHGQTLANFPWAKGKAPIASPPTGETAYYGRNMSSENFPSNSMYIR